MTTALRLLTYNVRSLRDDVDAVARTISAARPDVVCVQEAPRFLRWRTKCADLARRSGLVVVTGGRTAAGNLLLCQVGVQVEHTADVLLSPAPGLHRRGAAVAVLRLRGHRFVLVGTHLDLDPGARLRHARELLDRLPQVGVPPALPLVVAGDVNEEPGQPAWSLLATDLVDVAASAGAPTFPTSAPRQRIDAIFADRRIAVRSCEVVDSPDVTAASDHHPVLAELELPADA
jgi:endonuclease/exonuclease/phosphatase family metal-dependent hydrolase